MLSYKHGYHAGNQADVFKHICLIQAYKSLKKLNNSISYIDTHAGSGDYDFKSDYMSKNKEYDILLKMKASRDIKRGTPIHWEYVE